MLIKLIYLLFLLFITSENRYICYSDANISVLFSEDVTQLILPHIINFHNIEQFYNTDFSYISTKTISYVLERSRSCNDLLSIKYKGLNNQIQINTFEIKAGNMGPIITQFRLELRGDFYGFTANLENIDSNMMMYINIGNQNYQKNENVISNVSHNFSFKLDDTYVYECIFIKYEKNYQFIRIPLFGKLSIPNVNRLAGLLINFEYKYKQNLVNVTLEYFAKMTYCNLDSLGFDFVFKQKPINFEIRMLGSDRFGKKILEIKFKGKHGKIVTEIAPKKGDLGFEPKIFDFNKAISKNTGIPNLVLEPLNIWGICLSLTHKIVEIKIYERFGFRYYHYGLYPIFHSNDKKIVIWESLSYADLEEKVRNGELFCQKLN